MNPQTVYPAETLITLRAAERFLIGVGSFMVLKVMFELKFLVTLAASERPFV